MSQSGVLTLNRGDNAIVEAVHGNKPASKRLADLGFVRGARILMVSPGSPCILRIDGRCVGLGRDHQRSIRFSLA